jgi:dTDP-4-amino-4,6-dideoxygalactose transaminase
MSVRIFISGPLDYRKGNPIRQRSRRRGLARELRQIPRANSSRPSQRHPIGQTYRMSSMQAALGTAQLDVFNAIGW